MTDKITTNAPRTDKQKLNSALERIGQLNGDKLELLRANKTLERRLKRQEDLTFALTKERDELEAERDGYRKVAEDHKEISTCVNEYRYIKKNKHLLNKEQRSATYEDIVDRLLKCVAE